MSIFVIGATGYIGAEILKESEKEGIAFGTSTSGIFPFLRLNLEDHINFDYEIIKPYDAIFFTAAISSPDICANQYDRAWAVNVTGTSAFIEKVIAKGCRVVFFSSDTVYGETNEPFDESAICNPAGEYAEMKHEVENRFLGHSLFKTIRLSYVFSSEDKFTRYLSNCAVKNDEAEIFHPFYRSVIYRNDVVRGVLELSKRWDEITQPVINFGGPEVLSRIDFAQILKTKVLTRLRFRITEPESQFFKNRPRRICMMAPILSKMLGRLPLTLSEAIRMEFNLQ